MSTKLTLKNEDGEYSAEVPCGDMTLDALIELLVRPVLLAAGYHPDNVRDALDGGG